MEQRSFIRLVSEFWRVSDPMQIARDWFGSLQFSSFGSGPRLTPSEFYAKWTTDHQPALSP